MSSAMRPRAPTTTPSSAPATASTRTCCAWPQRRTRPATTRRSCGSTCCSTSTGQWQACEINADCPGGHNEALGLPRLARAAGFLAGRDPTHVVERLVAQLRVLADGGAVGLLLATAYAEDLQVCALVAARARARPEPAPSSRPPTAPRLRERRPVIRGEPVRALYRYFPTEWMSGQRNVAAIGARLETQRVRTLTSPAHIFTQSKLAFARTWEGREAGLASAGDPRAARRAARRHAPRDRARGGSSSARWGVSATRSSWGRSSRGAEWGRLVDHARALASQGEAWIAQRFVPQRAVPTPWGDRLVTLGAYVVDGRFAGYFARLTP